MTLDLPDFANLRERFGHVGNKDKTVRAAASGLFVVENDIILAAEIDDYCIDERSLARRHLVELKKLGHHNDLILYDRGYPSREWIAYHMDEGIDFVMRAKDAFLCRKGVYREEQDILQTLISQKRGADPTWAVVPKGRGMETTEISAEYARSNLNLRNIDCKKSVMKGWAYSSCL